VLEELKETESRKRRGKKEKERKKERKEKKKGKGSCWPTRGPAKRRPSGKGGGERVRVVVDVVVMVGVVCG